MENEGSHRRECVIALWIREKRKRSEEKGGGVSGWRRSRQIVEKEYRREEETEKRERERDTSERRDAKRKEAEPAERLGRFIPDQLHFQPSSEYKRQFNYRGIFKGGSHPPLSLSLSFLPYRFYLCPFIYFVPLSVNGISLRVTTRELDTDTRATRCRSSGYSSHLCAHR